MAKLTKEQQDDVLTLLKQGVDQKEIRRKYDIDAKQMYNYRQKLKKQNAKLEKELVDPKNTTASFTPDKTSIVDPRSEEIKIPVSVDPEELSSEDLFDQPQATPQQQPNGLDPNKDYCGNCYKQGYATIINKSQSNCSYCGAELLWQQ